MSSVLFFLPRLFHSPFVTPTSSIFALSFRPLPRFPSTLYLLRLLQAKSNYSGLGRLTSSLLLPLTRDLRSFFSCGVRAAALPLRPSQLVSCVISPSPHHDHASPQTMSAAAEKKGSPQVGQPGSRTSSPLDPSNNNASSNDPVVKNEGVFSCLLIPNTLFSPQHTPIARRVASHHNV